MNGNGLFVDTNVLLYVLGGDVLLKDQINHKTLYISFITELELLSFSRITDQQSAAIRKMLKDFEIIPYSESIKELIIQIRR